MGHKYKEAESESESPEGHRGTEEEAGVRRSWASRRQCHTTEPSQGPERARAGKDSTVSSQGVQTLRQSGPTSSPRAQKGWAWDKGSLRAESSGTRTPHSPRQQWCGCQVHRPSGHMVKGTLARKCGGKGDVRNNFSDLRSVSKARKDMCQGRGGWDLA